MGLLDRLQGAFGAGTDAMVAVAAYMVSEGGELDGIDDFQERNFTPGVSESLTARGCGELFEALDPQKFKGFFTGWVRSALRGGAVCYGLTSVSSYARAIPDLMCGYDRDPGDYPRFDIGMFRCESGKLPVYYDRCVGSLTDEGNLSQVLAKAKSVGIGKVKLILDGGPINDDYFKSINGLCDSFTVGIPTSLGISKAMIGENIDGITREANELNDPGMFCVQKGASVCGIGGKLMLYFDPVNRALARGELSARVGALSAELAGLKGGPIGDLEKYAKYFALKRHEGGGFGFAVDDAAVERSMKPKGFFLVFTTDMAATPVDTLYHYRARDADGKAFDQIKLDMVGGRVHGHNERATEGKVFVTFLALAIRAYMLGKLDGYLSSNQTSFKKVIKKLENIMAVQSNGKPRLVKALTEGQKEILAAFDAVGSMETSPGSCLR
ncbi:MAG: hypothetical protein LBF58_07450 [Deltaproteobacteria bacterium]|nr:hypothetical protein [Deltaproteobacteria bacterium]